MRQQLGKRLQGLKGEFETGQRELADLESQANAMRNVVLRISSAIQVLEEELDKYNRVHSGGRASLTEGKNPKEGLDEALAEQAPNNGRSLVSEPA